MKRFEACSVLVVGGAGFVGSNLVRSLLSEGASRIVVVDNFLSSEPENLPADPRITVLRASVADDQLLAQLHDEFEYIFHLATYHGNQSSIHNPLADHENNTLTTLKLLERIKEFRKLKKVVYSAAGCSVAKKTFDETEATEETDLVSLHMDSPYSMSKVFGEFYSVYYHRQHGVPVVRARFQNVYGPGEVLGAGEWRGTPATVWRNVTPTFMYHALHKRKLPLENEGIATRDFIYVDDIVEGLLCCALHGTEGDVYNLASGVETSIRSLAETINALTDNPAGIELKPARQWDTSGRRYGSTCKAREELGFEAKTDLQTGLQHMVDWFKAHMDRIERCIDKHRRLLPS